MNSADHKVKLGPALVLKSLSFLVLFIVLTFVTAGRLNYWQGWVFNGLNIFFLLVTSIVLRDRRDLIKERLKPGEGTKKWDKVYTLVSTPLYFAMFLLSVLDAARFSWTPEVPFIVIVVGAVMFSIGQLMILWAKKANNFFSSVVRIQTDRNQTVCTDGPYRFVRHPGYLGGLIMTLATPLLLGSYGGLLFVVPAMIPVFWRTSLEDKMLQAELPGYQDYSRRVRFRLLPHAW
jgi:protein-S-isoprenylcysteine O-methyltransferase Ste14